MKNRYIILGVALHMLSCGNGKVGKNEVICGGPGIGIDTATVHEIERYEDSLRAAEPVNGEFKDGRMPPPPPDSGRFDGHRPPPPPDGKHPDGPPPPPPDGKHPDGPPPPPPHEKGRPSHKPDNMRGFDPTSEDDMDDNGMSRYMENNDDEGWD